MVLVLRWAAGWSAAAGGSTHLVDADRREEWPPDVIPRRMNTARGRPEGGPLQAVKLPCNPAPLGQPLGLRGLSSAGTRCRDKHQHTSRLHGQPLKSRWL